jgi:hypothetical protein
MKRVGIQKRRTVQWESKQKQKVLKTGATAFQSNARIAAQQTMCLAQAAISGFAGVANTISIKVEQIRRVLL